MDAANYINTIDNLESLSKEPSQAGYAIIDLAVDDQFLRFLYDSSQQASVRWQSLLEKTRWQSSWQSGPVFLEFVGDSQFREMLIERMVQKPLGILVESSKSSAYVFEWAREWMLALADSDEQLFRFYDPRSFRPLLATFERSSKSIVGPEMTVYWSDYGTWHGYQSSHRAEPQTSPLPVSLSQAALSELPDFRLADRAMAYAKTYREHLPMQGDPRVWVMQQLQEASFLGFRSASLQERWLRLRILTGRPLMDVEDYETIMNKPDLSPADRLTAMESIKEATDANA